jgi:hypothetical protein
LSLRSSLTFCSFRSSRKFVNHERQGLRGRLFSFTASRSLSLADYLYRAFRLTKNHSSSLCGVPPQHPCFSAYYAFLIQGLVRSSPFSLSTVQHSSESLAYLSTHINCIDIHTDFFHRYGAQVRSWSAEHDWCRCVGGALHSRLLYFETTTIIPSEIHCEPH